jgi:hypothetical protein
VRCLPVVESFQDRRSCQVILMLTAQPMTHSAAAPPPAKENTKVATATTADVVARIERFSEKCH